jgi:hypothetical protein
LVGADHLLAQVQADTLIADKAFDAEKRVIQPLQAAGKTAVIPPKKGRKSPPPATSSAPLTWPPACFDSIEDRP